MDDFMSTGDYRSSDKNNSLTAITFLIVGLGIGAIAALLMAPKSGKQMRKIVRRKYEDARDTVDDFSDKAGDYWDKGSEWASNQKERVRPLVKKIISTEEPPAALRGGVPALTDETIQAQVAHAQQTASMIDVAQVQGQVHAQSVHRVGELADRNPGEAAAIIRQWLAEPQK